MWKKNKVDKRAQLVELMEAERAEIACGDHMKREIAPVSNRSMRKVKAKRKKLERNLELASRPEARSSIWLKMSVGSSFLVLALFAIPVAVGLLIMLATIPEVIRDLDVLPSTIIVVTTGAMALLFVQSSLISAILVFMLRLRNLRLGTIITCCISLVPVFYVLNFFVPIFELRGLF